MKTLIIGMLFLTSTAFAQERPWDHMASCVTTEPRQAFTLYRDPSDPSVGALIDYNEFGDPVEHIMDIQYTNGGARAIVTSEDLPMLILISAPRSVIHWKGKTWNCRSRLSW
jgi:hypothetical protein